MALISCRECGKPVSTEAVACPHCGAPPHRLVPPPLPVKPSTTQQKEDVLYSDNMVAVTNTRVVVGGTTYALRNITSVRMALASPPVGLPILLTLCGAFLLMLTVFPTQFHYKDYDPTPGFVLSGGLVIGGILWICSLKPKYHVDISSSAGEFHVLTSKNKNRIERIVLSVNEAMAKYK